MLTFEFLAEIGRDHPRFGGAQAAAEAFVLEGEFDPEFPHWFRLSPCPEGQPLREDQYRVSPAGGEVNVNGFAFGWTDLKEDLDRIIRELCEKLVQVGPDGILGHARRWALADAVLKYQPQSRETREAWDNYCRDRLDYQDGWGF